MKQNLSNLNIKIIFVCQVLSYKKEMSLTMIFFLSFWKRRLTLHLFLTHWIVHWQWKKLKKLMFRLLTSVNFRKLSMCMSPNARDEKDSAWQNHSHRRYRVNSILTFSNFFPRSSFRSEVKDLLSRLSWVAMFRTRTVNIYKNHLWKLRSKKWICKWSLQCWTLLKQ